VRPVVYRAAAKRVETLGGRGFFLGHSALLDIAEYSEESIEFAPADKVLFYTDGLTEGCNPANELYGIQRLLEVVEKNGHREPRAFLDAVVEDQARFRNGQELRDDFSMLCIETISSEWLLKESGFTREDEPRVLMASTYVDIDHVCSTILRAMDDNGYSDTDIKHAKICIFEMLMNAIEHGNRGDSRKKVIILYAISPEQLRVSVIDEGEGYDYRSLPSPLTSENILKDHGRGVFLIREYMDDVTFNDKGNRILVVKRHGGSEKNGN